MKYQVPAEKADPKAQMTEITNMPDALAECRREGSYMRLVEFDGKQYTYTTDLKRFRGEDLEYLK